MEAVFVIPVVMITLMIVIRMCVVHYQNVAVSAEAMRAASRAGTYWQEILQDDPPMFQKTESAKSWITENNFLDHNPYQSLVDAVSSGNAKKRLQNAKEYAEKLTGEPANVLEEQTEIENVKVEMEKGLLQNYVKVTVTRKNENPISNLYEKFSFREDKKNQVTAKGIQTNPTDFLRMASFLYDVVKGGIN